MVVEPVDDEEEDDALSPVMWNGKLYWKMTLVGSAFEESSVMEKP